MDKIHFVLLGTIFIIAKRFSGSFRSRTDITVAAQPGNPTPLSARIYPDQRFTPRMAIFIIYFILITI